MTSTHYAPLKTETAEIRIMIIEEAQGSSDTSCTLQTVSLADANPFYALSYVWGDANDMQTFILNGQRIKVRRNLCDFIRSLRKVMKGPIRVWVDYLCINQDDLDERATQVAMMGQIYSTADSVYAWLGVSTTASKGIINYLEQSKVQRSLDEPFWQTYTAGSTIFDALEDLLQRPYWTRLWIIQEIVLAKRLWLFCGSDCINWHDLHSVLVTTKGLGSTTDGENRLYETTRLMKYLKESRETASAMSLSDLVHKFISAQCQDQRDKIYGLLSLAHQDTKQMIKVDYRRPLLQVLLDTYPFWASEWVLDQDNVRNASHIQNAYTPALFCQELGLLFTESHLLDLYDKQMLRDQITARVMLKGFWQGGKFEFRHIAVISGLGKRLIPINQSASIEQEALPHATVSQMITPHDYDVFVYTTTPPLPTDRIINVGPIMLIIRQKDDSLFVAGRGIQTRCTATESIFDPCLWRAQLLPDTVFELEHSLDTEAAPIPRLSVKQRDGFVNVALNAAALVEVLIANKEQDHTWRPHDFGLQHGIIDMCRNCRLKVQYGRRNLSTKSCRCMWTYSEQATSSCPRIVRRHNTLSA